MKSQLVSFDKLKISIDLTESKDQLITKIKNTSLRSPITADQQKSTLRFVKKRGEKYLHIHVFEGYLSDDVSMDESKIEKIPTEVIREQIILNIFIALHRFIYPHVRVFPTERTTIVTLPFVIEELNRDDASIRNVIPNNQNIREMITPVNIFLNMLNRIYQVKEKSAALRNRDAQRNPRIKEYIRLAGLLETKILGGEVDFLTEPGLPSDILFHSTNQTPIEIALASSMVKELSPLVLYLRYLAKPGELLVIDEPEMNLHPKAQAQIIEFLAMLMNAGLHVLVTTHSPYAIDHLTNLIKADEHADKDAISSKFYLQDKSSFIAKESVSVYLVEDGTVKDMLDEEMEKDTFGDVSDRISEIYFKL